MTTEKLAQVLESLLFVKTQPLSIKQLANGLNQDQNKIKAGLKLLKEKLSASGVKLFTYKNKYELVSDPENTPYIKKFTNNLLPEKLSKIALETLAIIAYQGPLNRFTIEEIRGVNCVWILRRLLVRGLIIRRKQGRDFIYLVSREFLKHLGLDGVEDLPNYQKNKNLSK